jgi:hypothetical protein
VFLSLFSNLKFLKPDIVAVQDPFLFNGRPLNTPGFTLIFDHSTPSPKVATYINNNTLKFTSYITNPSRSPNTLSITIYIRDKPFQIVNIYNTPWNPSALIPEEIFLLSTLPTIVLGDFNLHSPLADPLRHFRHREIRLSEPFFDLAADRGYQLLNTPGIHTHFPHAQRFRPSSLDLAFGNSVLSNYHTSWDNNSPPTGSDHTSPRTRIYLSFNIAPYSTPDWNNIDWNVASNDLQNLVIPEFSLHDNLDSWFDHTYSLITNTMSSTTTIRRPSLWSKRWWSPDISEKRKIFHHLQRNAKHSQDQSLHEQMKTARKAYFKSIQSAKRKSWDLFLANAKTNDIWTAKKLAFGKEPPKTPSFPNAHSPTDLRDELIKGFFPPKNLPPPPPQAQSPHSDFVPIDSDTITFALKRFSNISAPGPDHIQFGIWKKVHASNPSILPTLFNPLLQFGYHPTSLKKALGVVLPKPGNPTTPHPPPSESSPSYRLSPRSLKSSLLIASTLYPPSYHSSTLTNVVPSPAFPQPTLFSP